MTDDEQVLASVLDHLNGVSELRRHLSPQITARVAMLAVLGRHGEMRVVEIADRLLVDMSVVSRQLAHLVQDGLAHRRPNPDDGRSCLASATAAGDQVVADVRREQERRLAGSTAAWDRVDLAALADLLGRLRRDMATQLAVPTPGRATVPAPAAGGPPP